MDVNVITLVVCFAVLVHVSSDDVEALLVCKVDACTYNVHVHNPSYPSRKGPEVVQIIETFR